MRGVSGSWAGVQAGFLRRSPQGGNEFGVCRNKLFFGSGYHQKLDDIQLEEYSLTVYHSKKVELRRGQVGRHGEAPSISSASSLGLD